MLIKNWNIEAMTGYKPQTTFYTDFSIAEMCDGVAGVRDTYKRAFNEWKNNVVFLTELVMVLNWKIWEHHGHNEEYARVYNELWETADAWACNNLTGGDLIYFYRTTD